ncbi:MAG: ExbD/TolR family protein [Spirochaetia bacterium]
MKFKQRLTPISRVDLIPLIDVVFQLVVFFMVTSTFLLTPGIGLVLPESETADPVVMGKLVVTVSSRDEIYVNQDRYTLQSFGEALQEMPEGEREDISTVILEGDTGVPYGLLVAVLDELRTAGFRGINLRTREEE